MRSKVTLLAPCYLSYSIILSRARAYCTYCSYGKRRTAAGSATVLLFAWPSVLLQWGSLPWVARIGRSSPGDLRCILARIVLRYSGYTTRPATIYAGLSPLGAGIPGLGESREIGPFRLFLISFVGTVRTGGCYTISFSACVVLGGDCVGSCRLEGF